MKKNELLRFHQLKIDETPGFLLWQVAMCWQRNINKALLDYGLTYTQFVVLSITVWLKKQNEEVFQHQVAKCAKIDRMMTSRVIASLERKKFISRLKKGNDARANLVNITPLGEIILNKALSASIDIEKKFFSTSKHAMHQFTPYMQEILNSCFNTEAE